MLAKALRKFTQSIIAASVPTGLSASSPRLQTLGDSTQAEPLQRLTPDRDTSMASGQATFRSIRLPTVLPAARTSINHTTARIQMRFCGCGCAPSQGSWRVRQSPLRHVSEESSSADRSSPRRVSRLKGGTTCKHPQCSRSCAPSLSGKSRK